MKILLIFILYFKTKALNEKDLNNFKLNEEDLNNFKLSYENLSYYTRVQNINKLTTNFQNIISNIETYEEVESIMKIFDIEEYDQLKSITLNINSESNDIEKQLLVNKRNDYITNIFFNKVEEKLKLKIKLDEFRMLFEENTQKFNRINFKLDCMLFILSSYDEAVDIVNIINSEEVDNENIVKLKDIVTQNANTKQTVNNLRLIENAKIAIRGIFIQKIKEKQQNKNDLQVSAQSSFDAELQEEQKFNNFNVQDHFIDLEEEENDNYVSGQESEVINVPAVESKVQESTKITEGQLKQTLLEEKKKLVDTTKFPNIKFSDDEKNTIKKLIQDSFDMINNKQGLDKLNYMQIFFKLENPKDKNSSFDTKVVITNISTINNKKTAFDLIYNRIIQYSLEEKKVKNIQLSIDKKQAADRKKAEEAKRDKTNKLEKQTQEEEKINEVTAPLMEQNAIIEEADRLKKQEENDRLNQKRHETLQLIEVEINDSTPEVIELISLFNNYIQCIIDNDYKNSSLSNYTSGDNLFTTQLIEDVEKILINHIAKNLEYKGIDNTLMALLVRSEGFIEIINSMRNRDKNSNLLLETFVVQFVSNYRKHLYTHSKYGIKILSITPLNY